MNKILFTLITSAIVLFAAGVIQEFPELRAKVKYCGELNKKYPDIHIKCGDVQGNCYYFFFQTRKQNGEIIKYNKGWLPFDETEVPEIRKERELDIENEII